MCYNYRVEIYKDDDFSTLIQYIDLYVKSSHSKLFYYLQGSWSPSELK